MLNYVNRKIKDYRCRNLIKRHCEPDSDFYNSCKDAFLSKLCQEFPLAAPIKSSIFGMWLKFSLATFGVILFLGGGAVVYADKANVDYSNPLYSLKRVAETVRVTVAAEEQLPTLHTELAQRRLDEIKEIKAAAIMIDEDVATSTERVSLSPQDPATTTNKTAAPKKTDYKTRSEQKKLQDVMTNLRNQMRQEVSSVMDDIESRQMDNKSAEQLCNSVSKIMDEDEKTDGDESPQNKIERWNRLQKNCGQFINMSSPQIFQRINK